MLFLLPLLGWAISFTFYLWISIPFWIAWSYFGLGAKFFYFVPEVYQTPSLLEVMGVFAIVSVLKSIFLPSFTSSKQ